MYAFKLINSRGLCVSVRHVKRVSLVSEANIANGNPFQLVDKIKGGMCGFVHSDFYTKRSSSQKKIV